MPNENDQLEVKQVIHDSIGWALNKDIDRLFSVMAKDEDFFIFHPDSHSTIRGFAAFKAMAEKSFMNESFKATDFAIKDLRMKFSISGDCAWWSCILDDHATFNNEPCGWDDARWTGILEKCEGKWLIMQMHFSFAKDD